MQVKKVHTRTRDVCRFAKNSLTHEKVKWSHTLCYMTLCYLHTYIYIHMNLLYFLLCEY